MKKIAILAFVLILAALSGYYYAFMKPRFVQWLGELFPGAEVSCSYIAPLPFANRVYAGDVQVFRKASDSAPLEFLLYCDSLVHYQESVKSSPEGEPRPVLALKANNLAAKIGGVSFSLDQAALVWSVRDSAAGAEKADGGKGAALEIAQFEAGNLVVEQDQKLILTANRAQGRDFAFLPMEWKAGAADLQADPWLFLLSKRVSVGELTLQGLETPSKDEASPSFVSTLTFEGANSPEGLDFQLKSLSEVRLPPKEGAAVEPAALQPGVIQDNLSKVSSIAIDAAIPWADRNEAKPAPASAAMALSLPLVIDVEFSGDAAAPSIAEAAAWLNACAHQEPPFMRDAVQCLQGIGFDQITVNIADKGVREKLNNFFSGSGNLLYLLDYEGRHGFSSSFLALAHMVFEQIEISPTLTAGAIIRNMNGSLYPFRPDLAKVFEEGRILLQASEGNRVRSSALPLPANGASSFLPASEAQAQTAAGPETLPQSDPGPAEDHEAAPPAPSDAAPRSALSQEAALPAPPPPDIPEEQPAAPKKQEGAEQASPAPSQKTKRKQSPPPIGEPLKIVTPDVFPDQQFPRPETKGDSRGWIRIW